MRAGRPNRINSSINVTPLVDVVLVLLIIFMVMAPQLQSAAPVELPETERPAADTDDGPEVVVTIEQGGIFWIDAERVEADRFVPLLQTMAPEHAESRVAVKGDAHLTYGQVKQVLLALEEAGFEDVSLITNPAEES